MKLHGLSSWGVCMNLAGIFVGIVVVISDIVRAQRSTQWSEGSIRLVGGRSKNEGTVLIYHWSRWGAICDDYWDLRDAHVVCNELGYAGAKEAPRRSRFGKGRRRVWLSGLHCRGNERHVTMCYSRGWGNVLDRCDNYWSSAGVVCNPRTTSTSLSSLEPTNTIEDEDESPTTTEKLTKPTKPTTTTSTTSTQRPTTTTTTTTTERSTTTSTTPKPTTTTQTSPTPKTTTTLPTTTIKTEPSTTTRPTTTTASTTTKPTTTSTTTATTQSPTTTTTTKRTTTTEPPEYNRWIYNRELWRYFMYFRDGTFITSRPDPRYYNQINTTTTSTTTTTTTTTPRPRRINSNSIYNTLGGVNENSRVDVVNNAIDPYAPQNIRHRNENTIPRHEHRHHHHHNMKEGYVHDQPITDGDSANQIVENVDNTDDDFDAYVESEVTELPKTSTYTSTTTKKPSAPTYTEYRLVGGRDYSGYREGRLEVRLAHSFTWGVICGDNWELRAAMVTCKHFNAGHARLAQKSDYYGGSNMDKVVAKLRCTGKEERLEDCTVEKTEDTPGKQACSRAQSVAGVICETRLPDLVPELKAIEESAFLRDRYLYYLQCAYEEKCLSSSANALYGTRTWAYASRRLLHFSTIAKNIGTADFRPDIDRSQWEWHACHQHYHSMESFSHYDIIDQHGNQVAEGHKASFCLEDSRCDRGVFPKYDCQQFGHQGISVGCQDSYLADIDCQWIDVTDVKPGLYTLKIELNPNMRVAEISYDNNVAKCTLYFNTQQARVYDCKLDSLL